MPDEQTVLDAMENPQSFTVDQELPPNDVVAGIKAKYPAYASVPNDELTDKIARKYPAYTSNPSFQKDLTRLGWAPISEGQNVWMSPQDRSQMEVGSEMAAARAEAEVAPAFYRGVGSTLLEPFKATPDDLQKEADSIQSIRSMGERLGAIQPIQGAPMPIGTPTASSLTPSTSITDHLQPKAEIPEQLALDAATQNQLLSAAGELGSPESLLIISATMGAGAVPKVGQFIQRAVSGYFGYEGVHGVIDGAKAYREAKTPEEKGTALANMLAGAAIAVPASAHAIRPIRSGVKVPPDKPIESVEIKLAERSHLPVTAETLKEISKEVITDGQKEKVQEGNAQGDVAAPISPEPAETVVSSPVSAASQVGEAVKTTAQESRTAASEMTPEAIRAELESVTKQIAERPKAKTIEELDAQAEPTPSPVRKRLYVRPRSDGLHDILDDIQEHGGIKAPGEKPGGEYDGWSESMNSGAAALLRRKTGGLKPDDMIQAVQRNFPRVTSTDALWQHIRDAVAQRDQLKSTGGGHEAQWDRFAQAVSEPKSGYEKVNVDSLHVGDKITIKAEGIPAEEALVTHLNPDDSTVTIKDGTTFGTQDLPAGAEIYVKRGVKLGVGEKGTGDLFKSKDQPFNLAGEKGIDGDRIAAEKGKAEQAQQEAAELAAKQQAELPGTGDTAKTNTERAKILADKIRERFKTDTGGKTFTGPVEIINAAAEGVARAVEAGGRLADAIAEAVRYIRANYKGTDFNEAGFVKEMREMARESGYEESGQPKEAFTTATKEEFTQRERANRGEAPIENVPRTDPEAEAVAILEKDNAAGSKLVEKIIAEPDTGVNPVQQAILLAQKVRLKNEINREVADWFDESKPEARRIEAEQNANDLLGELNKLEQATKNAGKTWSDTGRLRQQVVADDYSFSNIANKARIEKGSELSEAEIKSLHELAESWEANQKEIQKFNAEQESAQREIDADQARKDVTESVAKSKEPSSFAPHVLAAAEKFAARMDKKADAAWVRLQERLKRTSANIDPTILSDVAIIGAAKITRGIVDIAKWGDAMAAHVGEWIRPHIQEAFAASNKLSEAEAKRQFGDKAGRAKRAIAKEKPEGSRDHAAEKKDITEGLIDAVGDGTDSPDIGRYARKLAENFIAEEVAKGRKPADIKGAEIDAAVHDVLKDVLPEITPVESRDAWTQYGKYKRLGTEPVKVRLREARAEQQKLSTLERLQRGEPGLKTGQERQAPTDLTRRREKEINELKKKLGITTTDPATQLRSALDAIHTRNKNRIADLRYENATKKRIVREKRDAPSDVESIAQREEIERLKKENREIFGERELTDEQRLNRAIKAAERAEVEAESALTKAEKGDFSKEAGKPLPDSAKLDEVLARTAAIREQTKLLKDLANPKKTPAEIALQSAKTRIANDIANLKAQQARMDVGDFSKPAKRPPVTPDAALMALKADKAAIQEKINQRLHEWSLANRTRMRKIWDAIKQLPMTFVNVTASLDVSAPRQGLVALLSMSTRPMKGWVPIARAFGRMFSATFSERQAHLIEQRIAHRPNALSGADKMAKIDYTELDAKKFTKYEDAAHSVLDDWAKTPYRTGNATKTILTAVPRFGAKLVHGSNRGFITFLNSMRASMFDELLRANFKDRAPTDVELRGIGYGVNLATGRGGMHPMTARVLSKVLWSPNLLMSRLKLSMGSPFFHAGSTRVRMVVAKEYARVLISGYILGTVANMFDDKEEEVNTSSDYGKIVRGNTRVDIWGGFQQVTVARNRIATATTTTLKGKEMDIGSERKFGIGGPLDVAVRFGRSKLRPDWSVMVNIADRKDFIGRTTDITTEEGRKNVATSLIPIPLAWKEINTLMKEHGFTEAMILEALNLFGAGVSVHEDLPGK